MPQRIVQLGQPNVATRAALTRSPSTCQASGWCVPRKLWTGSAATSLHQGSTPVVPWVDQASSLSIRCTSRMSSRPSSFMATGNACGIGLEPWTTIALSSLEPITAPMPGRPPERPSRLRMTAKLTMFSPPWPMFRTPAPFP